MLTGRRGDSAGRVSNNEGSDEGTDPRKVFEGKAEEWKEWEEDLEEYWELHHSGSKAALKELVATGDVSLLELALGGQATESKATMHALLRSLTVGETKKTTSLNARRRVQKKPSMH